ncbi:divergent polysaccharide deacetylase family protein [Dinoroseobacter sp. S124A]|uniref:divergent polysaccharide deacetylase family protein n=1 Tax=Dinoroseobacter sp. S124A TaxID=3415128 RepID=UPI003C79D6A4
MGKGLLSGLFWGGAASMILLVAASLYFPLRDLNDAMTRGPVSGERSLLADPPEALPGAELQETAPDLAAAPEAGADDAGLSQRASGSVPQSTAPQAPGLRQVVDAPPAGLDPLPPVAAAERDVAVESAAPAEPEAVTSPAPGPDLTLARPSPATAMPGGAAPALVAPDTGGDRVPTALPAPATDVPVVASAAPVATAPEVAGAAAPRLPMAQQAETAPLSPVAIAMPSEDAAAPRAPDAPMRTAPEVSAAPETLRLAAPVQAAPQIAEQGIAAPSPDLAPADLPLPPVAPRAVSRPAPPPQPPAPEPDFAVPATEEVAPPSGVLPRRLVLDSERFAMAGPGISGRIPRIGGAGTTPSALPDTPRAEAGAPVGALTRNGQDFAAPSTASLLSILVEASSDGGLDPDDLTARRLPLSVAIDPSLPEAARLATGMRAAGHDVLITLTGLPSRPEPRDIDVALSAHIARLPEAVGVWVPRTSPVLSDRVLLRHLSEVLAQTGHGLITPGGGLDAAVQEARRAGVPAAASFAEVAAQDALALRRTLDRIALRARTGQGGVVQAFGGPDVLRMLAGWSAGLPANEVAVAPVSAFLQRVGTP